VGADKSWDTELYEAKHNFVWKLGSDVVELLDPKPAERILDLGCGTGHLTETIAKRGAEVVGVDSSPAMIGQARQNYPKIQFVLCNASDMDFHEDFDAVFSNAALHWMTNAETVAANIARALKKGGRLAAEFGGKGNIERISAAIKSVLSRYYEGSFPESRTFFPSIAEYANLLDRAGLELQFANLFDRPTVLDGSNGLGDWIHQFKWYYFEPLPAEKRKRALAEVIEELRPHLWVGDHWIADYRRLRILAVKC
jgi:trans-aconitate methyltransferase